MLCGDYHTQVMTMLLKQLFRVWKVQETFSIPSSEQFWNDLKGWFLDQPELFTLEGQVNHKIAFIETYVPADVNLHFIGHSIGSKISVELVKRYRKTHNAAGYLLFPTLERMAETPSGRKLWPMFGPLRKTVVLAASFIYRLPESWLTTIVQWVLRKTKFE